ncbi:NUDIX domain-containing protein [Aidingimonas halophila]|uniref:ADP-ribose pyrophosphatase YjhB, NUDIX family n=1 Tax=Aidingimonas halophila TaxID=574349 RepID=A0A1H3EL86_9GAMM|nr:NUDIX hydrolase [Aidingimonas halophila]GHC31339.1 NUDIX hydrolase [Aidingimonas halophila]SDX79502.1 ADP-ribose pyrophosphatase YjhB, NUDIX family [Aidingimonas halophila]
MTRWTPHVAVATVVERAGRYLMVEEDRGGPFTLFNQPAGHLEPDETLLGAAEREAREETAWRVGITDYLGLYIYRTPAGITIHSHAYVGMALAHLGNELDADIHAIHWLTFDEIEDLDRADRLRSPLVMRRLLDARLGRVFPLDVIQER